MRKDVFIKYFDKCDSENSSSSIKCTVVTRMFWKINSNIKGDVTMENGYYETTAYNYNVSINSSSDNESCYRQIIDY